MHAATFSGGSREHAGLLLRALAAGLVGGASALALRYIVTWAPRLVWPAASDLVQAVASTSPVRRVVISVAGAALAGTILWLGARWSRDPRGWDVLEAVVLRNGVLPVKSTIVRAASAVVSQAAAAPVGREGPIVLLSATAASALGRRLGLSTRELRIMVGGGVAAGLACAYNAPIGAALFTMDILFGVYAIDVFAPLVVASVTATVLTWATFGRAPVFTVPSLVMASPWELVPHALLGLLGGAVAAMFLLALRGSAAMFARARLPRPVAMAAAGLVVGLVTIGFPDVVGNGRDAIGMLFERQWTFWPVVALLLIRLIVTPLTVGSGAVGGVFTPTLFIGAMLGQAFGVLVGAFAPVLHSDPREYALAGMACLLAGTTHAPLMATLMVFEMTLDYNVVVPLLLGSAIASLVATRFSKESVYTEALRRKSAAPEDAAARSVATLRVADLMRAEHAKVAPDCTAPRLFDVFVSVRRNHVYVVGDRGDFLGAVDLHDLTAALQDEADSDNLTARELMRERFPTTLPDTPLMAVLDTFAGEDCDRIPVLASARSRRLVGTISRRDILSAWTAERLADNASRTPHA